MNEAQRRAIKKYQQSPKGKIAVRNAVLKYQKSSEGKASVLQAVKKFFKTDKGRKLNVKAVQTYLSNKKGLQASLTVSEWEDVLDDFENKCAYCGAETELLQEHFIPVSKGGGYIRGNIVPACKPCNSRKRDKDPRDWLPREKYEQIARYLNRFRSSYDRANPDRSE